jgi:hypothetical protein
MAQIFICLLTLLFSLSSPAVEGNVALLRSSLAAETTVAARSATKLANNDVVVGMVQDGKILNRFLILKTPCLLHLMNK